MLYAVTATVTKHDGKGTTTYQVPTFYLNSQVQGIGNCDHAERIAREVVNPADDPALTVAMTVCTVFDVA